MIVRPASSLTVLSSVVAVGVSFTGRTVTVRDTGVHSSEPSFTTNIIVRTPPVGLSLRLTYVTDRNHVLATQPTLSDELKLEPA